MQERKRTVWTAGALALGSLALYAQSLTFGFVSFDDATVLLAHPALYDEHSFTGSLHEILVGSFPREEPLLVRDITWAVDSRIFGFTNPFGYHLGNVLLNACNVVLLFLFLKHATRRFGFAALVAALWACLPLHVEPVCWVMGRKDVLSTFFVLLALLVQSIALREEDPRRQRQANLLLLLLYVVAVLSKFSAVTLVAVLAAQRLLAEHLDGRLAPSAPLRWRVAARRLVGLWPHALVGLALYVWYNDILDQMGITRGRGPGPLTAQHLSTLAELTPLVLGVYFKNMASASQHAMSYDWPSTGIALTGPERLLSAGIAASLLGFGAWAAWRRKDLFFYAVVGMLIMLTYLNIVYIGILVADRYAYLSSFCVLAIVVQLGGEQIQRVPAGGARRVARGLALALAGAFGCYGVAASLRHEPAFHDAITLWAYEAAREHPSMVSLVARAKHFVVQAEGATAPAERAERLEQALQAIDGAEAHYRAVKWKPIDNYLVYAQGAYSELLVLRGRAAAVAGEPEGRQLAYYQQAFEFSGTWLAAMPIEQILFEEAARTEDVAVAGAGLQYLEVVIKHLRNDTATRPGLIGHLEQDYRKRFPALSPKIDHLELVYFR